MSQRRLLVIGALALALGIGRAAAQDSNLVKAKQNPLAALQTLFGGTQGRGTAGARGGAANPLDGAEGLQVEGTALGIQLKLIQPSDGKTTDPGIAEVSQALTGLFAYPGYKVLDQSWVALDVGAGRGATARASLRLNGKGVPYALEVWVDSLTPTAVRLTVTMTQVSGFGAYTETKDVRLFQTTVVVGFNKTIVLGATHPLPSHDLRVEIPTGSSLPQAQAIQRAAATREAELPLILTIRPERRGN